MVVVSPEPTLCATAAVRRGLSCAHGQGRAVEEEQGSTSREQGCRGIHRRHLFGGWREASGAAFVPQQYGSGPTTTVHRWPAAVSSLTRVQQHVPSVNHIPKSPPVDASGRGPASPLGTRRPQRPPLGPMTAWGVCQAPEHEPSSLERKPCPVPQCKPYPPPPPSKQR